MESASLPEYSIDQIKQNDGENDGYLLKMKYMMLQIFHILEEEKLS